MSILLEYSRARVLLYRSFQVISFCRSRVRRYNRHMAMIEYRLVRLEVVVALILAGVVSLVVKVFFT